MPIGGLGSTQIRLDFESNSNVQPDDFIKVIILT